MFKGILVLATLLGFGSAGVAAEYAYPETFKVSYTLDTFLGAGDRVYYNCDSVETSAKSLLKELGAENVKVRCSGGFDPYTGFTGPAYVTARFVAPTMTKNNAAPRLASVREITLRGHNDCHFMSTTLEALSEEIDLDVVSGPRSCTSSRTRTRYTVSVLAFEN